MFVSGSQATSSALKVVFGLSQSLCLSHLVQKCKYSTSKMSVPLDIKRDRYACVNFYEDEDLDDASYDGDADDDHSFASARENVNIDLEFIVNPTVDRTRYTFDRLIRACDDSSEGSSDLLSVASHDPSEDDDGLSYGSSSPLQESTVKITPSPNCAERVVRSITPDNAQRPSNVLRHDVCSIGKSDSSQRSSSPLQGTTINITHSQSHAELVITPITPNSEEHSSDILRNNVCSIDCRGLCYSHSHSAG